MQKREPEDSLFALQDGLALGNVVAAFVTLWRKNHDPEVGESL